MASERWSRAVSISRKAVSTELWCGDGGRRLLLVTRVASGPSRRIRNLTRSTELEPQRSQAVASGGADAFDEPFGTQLGQVVAQLAEAVVGLRQLMAGQDAGVQLTGRPVRGRGGGMQQRLQHTDQAVIVQLQASA